MSQPVKQKAKSLLWRFRVPLCLALGIGLLSQVARLDPEYEQRKRESALLKEERAAEQARIDALVPAAQAAPKGTKKIDFGDLAFDAPGSTYSTSSTGFASWMPPKVKELDGREVRLEGYMLPTKVENGRAGECLILANQMACCYGKSPSFCEFVIARMPANPAPVLQDQPLVFTGKLHVGDVFEGKAWTAFYTLDVTDVGR